MASLLSNMMMKYCSKSCCFLFIVLRFVHKDTLTMVITMKLAFGEYMSQLNVISAKYLIKIEINFMVYYSHMFCIFISFAIFALNFTLFEQH